MTRRIPRLAVAVIGGLLALSAIAPTAAQDASGSPAPASSGPFTLQMDWGTFTLDPAIQQRVHDKVAAGQPLDIPVFIWITGDEFFVPVRAGIAAAATEFNTTSQLLGPVEADQPQMISDIQSYLSRNPDGMAISPANPDDVQGLVDQLIDTGLPVVVWNTDIPKSKRLAYVGQDNTHAGGEVGKLMVAKLQEKGITEGTIAMFATDATAAYSKDLRFPGFRDAVSAALPNIKFAEPVTVGVDISAAVGVVDAAVRGKSDIVGMYSADEQVTALGTWASQNAQPDDYVIVGHNLLARELELMADGWIDGLVGQDPYYQGYGSVQFLHQFLTTGTTPCGPTCDSGYPVADSPEIAQQMLDSNCDGKGCG
jgi:simple sugar transport system substrate-binding protein